MNAKVFVDTNILVYAHDRGAARKHELAKSVIKELWQTRAGVVSTQVLQEFYVNVRTKITRPLTAEDAKSWVSNYLSWEVVHNDGTAILEAIDMEIRYQLSFWDALIVQAANRAGATLLYSEDLNHGQRYESVHVENPFLPEAAG